MTVDMVTERAARWLASRTTRRSFLSTGAKAAIVGVGGVAVAELFGKRAEARVCGQSGVSPRCPTFDCVGPDVAWGWCWYASPGCCANGGLKKICDCCGRNYPNVHGYCPEGSNVYCVVESCLEDPRVQKVSLDRFVGSVADISLARLMQRSAASARTIVVAPAGDVLRAAVAAPVAAHLGAPLVLIDGETLRPALRTELGRVGVERLVVVGAAPDAVLSGLRDLGAVEILTASPDVALASVEVATWFVRQTGRTELVCVGAGAEAVAVAPAVAAFAAARGLALVIGPDAVGAARAATSSAGPVTLVGDEVVAAAGSVSSSTSVPGTDPVAISVYLADRVLEALGTATVTIGLAPRNASAAGLGLLPFGGPLLLHADLAVTDEFREWLISRRKRFAATDVIVGGPGGLSDHGVYALQSALNGFDAHLLVGTDGMGLPVIVQPLPERMLGAVRVSGELPATTTTLVSRANQRRSGPTTTAAVRTAPPVTPPPHSVPPA